MLLVETAAVLCMSLPEKESVPWSALDDQALLRRFCRGESGALDEILVRYEQPLVGFLTGYLGDPALAQDITQETLLKLVRKPPRRLKKDSLRPWLFRVARNMAVDAQRRQARIRPLDTIPEPEDEQNPVRLCPDDAQYLIGQLPEEMRMVVSLRVYGDLTFEAIAEELKIPLGTALWRMRRALQLMKASMEEQH